MTAREPNPSSLCDLQRAVDDFAAERDWHRFHNPRNVAEAIVIEAGELLECFLWRTDEECSRDKLDEPRKQAIESELADVIIYALNLANAMAVDAATLIERKLSENARRFSP